MDTVVWNGPWMAWNVVLALAPFGLAVLLFRQVRRTTLTWWLGVAMFVAFLPNAAYVLTDVIHLSGDLSRVDGRLALTSLVLLQYGMFFAIGLAAYAAGLFLVRRDLRRRGASRRSAVAAELGLHALCAVGVLLGRYPRFNSWDLVTRPGDVAAHLGSRLDRPFSWGLLVGTFVVLAVASVIAQAVGGALALEWRALRARTGR